MKITFLGTGTSQGIPIIGCRCRVCSSKDKRDKRLRTSILIETQGKKFVIDTGPDFRQQMLREKVNRIDAVLYTHSHRDHVAGLDELRAFNFIMKKKMDLYANRETIRSIRKQFYYVFYEKKYPGLPEIKMHSISNKSFHIKGVPFNPVLVKHLHLPVYGYRMGDFTYITDANFISEKEKKKIIGSQVLVLNALRNQQHLSHFSLGEAVQLAKELRVKKTFLVHMSHQLGRHAEIEKNLPGNIRLAYDGLSLVL